MISAYLAYQFAGLWALVWHFGLGGVLVIGCLAAAYFSPVFKKEFIWAAALIAAVMVAVGVGVNLGEKRIQAQWDQAKQNSLSVGKKARVNGVRDAARTSARKLPVGKDPDLRD